MSYRFEPGASDDGVTVHVPVEVLSRLGGEQFGWQVPALREELVTALIRSLPKELRRSLVPAPDTARAVLANLDPGQEPLLAAVQRELHRLRGVLVPIDAFDLDKLPSHLRVTFAIEDEHGNEVARGKDLAQLQEELAAPVRAAVAAAVGADVERTGLTAWPERTCRGSSSGRAASTPCAGSRRSSTTGTSVSVRVFATAAEQEAAMPSGVRRLVRLAVPSPVKAAERSLSPRSRLVLGANPDGSIPALLDDCADAAVDSLVGTIPWDEGGFTHALDRVRAELVPRTIEVVERSGEVLAAAHEVRAALPSDPPPAHRDAVEDVRGAVPPAAPCRLRRRGRSRAAARPDPLPHRDRAAARAAAARRRHRPRADDPRPRRAGRVRRPGARAARGSRRRPPTSGRSAGSSRSFG